MSEEILRLKQDITELPGRVIDVAVWGASRPHLFKQTIESFRDNTRFSGKLRFFLEDGDFDHEKALESASIAKVHGFDGIHLEQVGSYGYAMTHAMDRWIRAPLMFHLEDDWLCVRELDLDLCFDCFMENSHVNQMKYNRRKNVKYQNDGAVEFCDRTLTIKGKPYAVQGSVHWYFNPSVWRMSFVRPRWGGAYNNVHLYMNSENGFLPPHEGNIPSEWYADTLGAYIWGPVKEPRFFVHIGEKETQRHQ